MNTLDLFSKETDLEEYASGQIIFEQGQPGRQMYVIKGGEIEIKVGDGTLMTLAAGEIFGEMALIDSSPRSGTAVAKTDCSLIPIDEKRFTFLVQQTPFFSLHVMRILAHRLRKMNDILAHE